MQRVVWIVAGIGFLLWSLLAWAGHAVLDWLADFTAGNAGQLTANMELADWLAWAAGLAGSAGGALIVVVWLFGSAVIALAAFGISRLVLRYGAQQRPRYEVLPPGHR